MDNKRGQGMSTNAIILIILGVVVLVILILGFTMGWQKLAPWISSNNVDTIVANCDASCATNGVHNFCMVGRTLKAEDVKLKEVTCNYLANNKTVYGVNKCASIPCDNVMLVEAVMVEDLENYCVGNEGKFAQALIEDTLHTKECVEVI